MEHNALLLGGSGLVGGHCLRLLLESGRYQQVHSVGRRELTIDHPQLRQHIGDLDDLDGLLSGLEAQDLYCCLGTTIRKAGSRAAFRAVDHDLPLRAARLMQKHGLRHFLLVSAMGASPRSAIFYNRVKGEVETDLARLGLPALSIFRPSLLVGERDEHRPGEAAGIAVARCVNFAMRGPLRNYAAIDAETVARAMLRQAASGPTGMRILLSGEIADLGAG